MEVNSISFFFSFLLISNQKAFLAQYCAHLFIPHNSEVYILTNQTQWLSVNCTDLHPTQFDPSLLVKLFAKLSKISSLFSFRSAALHFFRFKLHTKAHSTRCSICLNTCYQTYTKSGCLRMSVACLTLQCARRNGEVDFWEFSRLHISCCYCNLSITNLLEWAIAAGCTWEMSPRPAWK